MADKRIDGASTGQVSSNVVGKIMGTKGDVIVVTPDGSRVKAGEGQKLRLNDKVLTEGGSVAVIQLEDLKTISLGHDEIVKLDKSLLDSLEDIDLENSISGGINFDAIEQSLESGLALDDILPAPAAGGDDVSAALGSAGSNAARIERTATEVTPESGFETSAFLTNFQDIVFTENNFEQDYLSAILNNSPIYQAISNSAIDQDQDWTLNLADYFSDPDQGQSLAYQVDNLPEGLVFDPVTGIISGSPTNAAAFLNGGEYLVNVTAQDNSGGDNSSVTTSFTLSVNNINDLPSVNSEIDAGSINEDGTITFTQAQLLAGATDVDQDALQVISMQLINGSGQILVNGAGNFEFTPAPNWNGIAEFSYVISDGQGGEISNTATLNVHAVNDAPVAVGDGVIGTEINTSLTLNVLANDYDVDGDDISIVSARANFGTVDVNSDGTITYHPPSGYVGRDMVTYTIADGSGAQSTSLALVNIIVGNTPPVLGDDASVDVNENTTSVGNFSATDAQNNIITYSLGGADANLFEIDQAGNLTFIAAPDFEVNAGPFNVTVIATDNGLGNLSDAQALTINVLDVADTGVNNAPVLGDDVVVSVDENTTLVENFAGSDTDGDALIYSVDNALFTIDAAGNLSFASAPDFETNPGPFSVSITVTDTAGLTDIQNIVINVADTNEIPVISGVIASTVSEDDASYSLNLLAGASDPDASDSLNVSNLTLTGGDASGVTVDGNTLDINPNAYNALAVGESAIIIYSYDVIDSNGGVVAQSATITITGANDAPLVATAITSTATEDDASYSVNLLAGASEADASDTLTVNNLTLTSGDASGVTINGNALDINPNAYNALAVGESAIITYSYDIEDGNGGVVTQSATITITGANDTPSVATVVTSTATEDDASYSLNLLDGASDPDASDVLNVANLILISGDASGITINGNALDINPNSYNSLAVGESAIITYGYDIEDGNGGVVTQSATITITGANDGPAVASAITSTATENISAYSLNLLDGASDPDASDVLNVTNLTLIGGDASGVTINGNALDIDPSVYAALADGESEIISYTYDIVDGNGGVVAQSATITITGANDGPAVSASVVSSASEDDASYSLNLLDGASDPDSSDVLNVNNLTFVSGDASGITVNGNTLDINPNAYNALAVGESAVITYSYDVIDGNGGSVAQSATITITGANDGPSVASAITSIASEDDASYSIDLLAGASDADASDVLNVANLTLVSGDASGITINGNALDINPNAYNALAVGESAIITYSYNIEDGNGGSVAQSATITITGANDAPSVASTITSTATENSTAYSLNLLDGASDPDSSDVLNINNLALTGGDASGVSINGNALDIDPSVYAALADGESEIISYTYDIVDGNGGTVSQTATITITGGNGDPVVSGSVVSSINEDDASYSLNLLDGASDPDASDVLNVNNLTLVSGDASGITINGNALDVNPNAYNALAVGESAVITYSYGVIDGNGGSVAQSATITITGANDGPSVASAITSTATENSTAYSVNLLDGASDPDSSDVLNINNLALTGGDASGVSINGNALDIDPSVYATLADGESEIITYTYDIVDGNGGIVSQTATITITGGNGDPVVSGSVVSSATEDDASYSLNLLDGASDPDASDVLNVNNLTLTSGDASGVNVNGNALDINPNAYNALAVGESAIITYSYDIEDGNGGSVAQSATITITGANDGPAVSASVVSSASENDASYSLNLLDGASDSDSSDTLNVTNLTLVSGDASGVTINGNALDINPNTYNALGVGESAIITYNYDIEDGNGGSVAQTATITITGANDAPSVATVVTSTATEDDASYSVDLLAGASDPDASDVLNVNNLTLVSGDASGITVNGNTLDINPNAYNALAVGESAVITYSYDIEDGNGDVVAQSAIITIVGANDGPAVASAVTSTATEDDASYSVNLLAGASDADASDVLNVANLTITGGDASGITINGNSLDINPNAYNALAVGESAIITYSYNIEDGNGGSVAQSATITITGANDGPAVASAVTSIATEDDASYSVNLLAGASDADASDTLAVNNLTLTSGDASGVTINGNALDINPNAYNSLAVGESAVITYSYDIEDGNGGSVAQSATITITGANDEPAVASAVTSTATEDDASYSLSLLDGASDLDSSDVLNVNNLTLTSGDASGITINGNALDINPNAYNALAVGESTVITYSYDVIDGNGGSVAQSATITITGANDGPAVATAVTSTATEDDASYSLNLLDGASDPDASDVLNVNNLTLVSGDASGVTINGNALNINPNAYNALAVGESAIITYNYNIVDGNGGSVAQNATITITGENDGPAVESAVTSTATEDDASYSIDLLAGASDADASDVLNVANLALVSGDASGVTINGNALDINPNAYNALAVGESAVITYSYDIEDVNGGSVAQSATITITGANDGPSVATAVTSTVTEDDASYSVNLLAGASDADASDTLNVTNLTLTSGDASGVTINGIALDVNPNAYNALGVDESTVITYSYDIIDGNGGSVAQSATITITGANDGPAVATAVTSTATEDDASYSLNLLDGASDPDASDSLNVSNLTLVSGNASGITINGNALDINPNAYNALAVGESAVITYSYDIEDGNGGSVAQTATITITGANDGPAVASAITSTATEDDASYSVNLLAGASDADASDTLNVTNLTLTSGDASGVTVNGNALDINPNAYNALAVGESTVITYSYDIEDGNGGSVAQSATITITGANDGPSVASAITSTASEDDASYSIDLLAGASDADTSDVLNVANLTLVSGDASGIAINGNALDINPNTYNALAVGESAVITYSYDIEDGNGGSVTQSATITITGANDGPAVASAVTSTATEDDASYSLNLLDGASDPDASNVLNVANLTLISGDASGITINGDALDINPNTYNALAVGESAVITYSYDVIDGNGGSVAQTATITITGANDAPAVATAVTSTASEDDASYSVNLLAGASDADASDTLNVTNLTLTSGDASGVTINGIALDINPNAYNALAVGESTVITYSYDVIDGNGGSVAQSATITITGANDGPAVASAITSTATENDASYSLNLLAGASDPDASDTLTVNNLTLTSGDASGVTVNGNVLDINPNAYNALAVGESAVITYSYDIEDGNGGTVEQSATITITGANDGPTVASAITSIATEDNVSYSLSLLDGASDPDSSDILNVTNLTLVSGDASGVTINGNALDINPNAYNALAVGESAVITYSYDVIDGNGGSVAQTAMVTITGANDGPAVASAITSIATEDDAAYSLNLLDGASDPDSSDILNVTNLTLVSGDASGVTINGNALDINPNAYNALAVGESAVITYSYDIEDGYSGSVAQSATITITGANDGPAIASAITSTATEDDASYSVNLLAGASDVDASDVLNVNNLTLVSGDASGVTINGNALDINPNAYNALAVGESAVITYSYDVEDGNGGSVAQTATITITGANDGPAVASAITSTATENDASYSLNLLARASDPDASDTLTVNNLTLVSGDASGVTVNGNALDINPNAYNALAVGESTIITYSYDIEDGNGGSVVQTATITITGANDAPIISSAINLGSINEDGSILITQAILLANASDVDASDTLVANNLSVGSGLGTITDNGNGTWIFNPAENWSGNATINFDVSDGSLTVASSASISVNAVADAPEILVNSDVINVSSENEIPPPASTGLLFSFYDELNNINTTAALQEGIIDPANATSQIRQINGFGNATIVTNTGVVQTNGSTIEIDTGDSYSVTGLIYLEAGNTYQFAGYHDDSLRIELGGQTMVSTTGDSYGNYGPGQAVVGNIFTATASGYYTIEAFVNNISGIGQFSLNLSVNGGAAQILNGSNFNIYTSLTDLAVAGGQFGAFVASTVNVDGGFFPQVINTGLIGTYIEISNIVVSLVDADGSESLQNIILSSIPVGATLTDGTSTFTASAGNTSIDLLAQGWNLSNIQILPPSGFVGNLNLSVGATSIEASNGDTASTTQNITVSVIDPGTAAGGLDPDLLGDSVVLEGSNGNDILVDIDSEIQFNAISGNVLNDDNAFRFSFNNVTTAISSISLTLLQGNWDPGTGGGRYGIDVGSQSSGISLNASNFSFSGGNTTLTIDLSTENISAGSTFSYGVDFDNVSGGSNAAGVMANLAVLTVTLEDGRTQSVLVDNSGDNNNNTAQANLQFNSDIIMGNDGDDTITTGAGDQLVLGGSGNDTITLGAGNDAAQGQQGNDTINGGNGNDVLSGGDGADVILGGAGTDIIFGDAGSDTLTGGSGRDTFVWRSQDADGSTDTITDFAFGVSGDILHMADVLDGESANAVSLDSYFNFSSNAGTTTITVDSDGVGGNTDLTIVIQGVDLVAAYGSDQAILQHLLDDGNLLVG